MSEKSIDQNKLNEFMNDSWSWEEGSECTGAVKTINSVGPDEDGDIALVENKTWQVIEMSSMPGMLNAYGVDAAEVSSYLRDNVYYHSTLYRIIMKPDGSIEIRPHTHVEVKGQDDGTNDVIVYHGDDLAPIIVDVSENTITLDPDWVAPAPPIEIDATLTESNKAADAKVVGEKIGELYEEIANAVPSTDQAHRQLVTDAEGKAKWEERTHYGEAIEPYYEETTYPTDKEYFTVMGLQDIVRGDLYKVTHNGSAYYCRAIEFDETDLTALTIGNKSIPNHGEDTKEPFYLQHKNGLPFGSLHFNSPAPNTIKIEHVLCERKQIDPDEYFPSTVPIIHSASIGQTIVVKAVDENSKPTEWETVDSQQVIPFNIIDGTAMGGTIQYDKTQSIADIVSKFNNGGTYYVTIQRNVMMIVDGTLFTRIVRCVGYDHISSSKRVTLYFGDEYRPIILDGVNDTVTLDPDWTPPSENSLTEDRVIALIQTELGVIENGTY